MSAANAAFAEKIRTRDHTINPDIHPSADINSLSSRAKDVTGYRPTAAAMVPMLLQEANALPPEHRAALLASLNA